MSADHSAACFSHVSCTGWMLWWLWLFVCSLPQFCFDAAVAVD
jgi:hypothetical protein